MISNVENGDLVYTYMLKFTQDRSLWNKPAEETP